VKPFTLQRTSFSKNLAADSEKIAPRFFKQRAHICGYLDLWRIASTAGVYTHGENERFGFDAGTLILKFWDSPKPLFAFLQTNYEYFDRLLDFIRIGEYNIK